MVEAMAGGVPVTWLAPELASEGVLVFLHGGGYFAGPDRGQWAWVAEVQRRTGLAAVMVLYRMPPRHPFPAALDDALSAIGALCATDQIRDGRWILSGDSAGGGLALVATQARRDAGEPLPAGLLLTAPWVDVAMEHPDTACPEREDLAVGRSILRWGAERYADGVPLDDPRLSPLNASMHGLPPVHLNVGAEDLFLADDRRFCAALEAAGVDVASIEQAGAGHVYPHRTTTPEAEWTIRSQVSWIRGHITPNDTITNEVAR